MNLVGGFHKLVTSFEGAFLCDFPKKLRMELEYQHFKRIWMALETTHKYPNIWIEEHPDDYPMIATLLTDSEG